MTTIELNDQQTETLKMILEAERINQDTSTSYNMIVNQIITKLDQAE